VKRRFLEPFSEQKPKVFGIGLSRTGTTSLAHALDLLGYDAFHWSRDGKVLGWPEFQDVDAATDTPCSVQFEALYHTFEDSKFIYTVRDFDEWKNSMKKYYKINYPSDFEEKPKEEAYWDSENNWSWYNRLRKHQIHKCLYSNHKSWEDAYFCFDDRVEHFFKNKHENRFLKIDITKGERWGPICSFLNTPHPKQPFPHRNPSE